MGNIWDGVEHNSRLMACRAPFGAVCVGSEIKLFIRVPAPLTARLRLWIEGGARVMDGVREGEGYAFRFHAPAAPGLFWYYFLVEGEGVCRGYGGTGGRGAFCDAGEPPGWQVTVYEPFETPDWFKTGICYQIFPDRFARGGARGGLDRAAYHRAMGRKMLLHEDWHEEVLYRPLAGEKDYDPCDFYGGDLAGIIAKLPYLKSLGVSCIYLNPVFEAASNHRYNTADYEKVDPILGSAEDLRELSEQAKALGIRLMLDGVFSHTGDDSVYFNKYGRYPGPGAYQGTASAYYPWYTFTRFPEEYTSWWGFKSLPEIRENEPSYLAFVEALLRRYAAMGITSWRLDVADELPDAFIAGLRRALKALDPAGVLLGEVWEDASNKQAYGQWRAYAYGQGLDGAMGYPFREAIVDYLLGRDDALRLADRLSLLREHYPKPFYEAQLNLLGSHDTVRILSVLSGAPHRDALKREDQARYAPTGEALAKGRKLLLLGVMAQMALPGVPCIYYGDEAGMTGMADPFCRRPYPWGEEDMALLACYRRLCEARTESSALRGGGCGLCALESGVFAALRSDENTSALLLLNPGELGQAVSVGLADFNEGPDAATLRVGARYRDALTGTEAVMEDKLHVVLPPLCGTLWIEV